MNPSWVPARQRRATHEQQVEAPPAPQKAPYTGEPRMGMCANCSSADLVNIALQFKGKTVDFEHCRACEHKTWTVDGAAIGLDEVLAQASA